jgi:hypothetical protein
MIKSSKVILSPTELREFRAGKVPTRLSDPPWELTLEELKSIVQLKQCQLPRPKKPELVKASWADQGKR